MWEHVVFVFQNLNYLSQNNIHFLENYLILFFIVAEKKIPL